MKLAIAALSASAVAFAAPATADVDWYGTAGYTHIGLEDADLGGLQLRGGINFNSLFGAEIEGAFGINDDEVGGIDVELDRQIGAFGTVRTQLGQRLEVFARAGWVDVEAEGSFGGVSASDGDDAGALGVGANFFLNDRHGLRAGYTYYDFDENADVFEIAYVLRFGG